MSAFKKVTGVVAGVAAVTVIGVAVAQSNPPNPYNQSGSEGAGEQTVHITPIGETGVLVEAPMVVQQNVATLTKQNEQAAVAPEPAQPVAQAPAAETTTVAQANTLPAPSNELGAGPEPAPKRAPKHDRG